MYTMSVFSIDICTQLQNLKTFFMNLLFAQAAANTPNESALMIIGVGAIIVALALLLWKNDSKATA